MQQPNQDKIRMHGEKETYKYQGISEADTIKHAEMNEKNNEKLPQESEKTGNQTTLQKSHQRDKYLGSPNRKIFRTISEAPVV